VVNYRNKQLIGQHENIVRVYLGGMSLLDCIGLEEFLALYGFVFHLMECLQIDSIEKLCRVQEHSFKVSSLSSSWCFNESWVGVKLPSSLRSLSFGDRFNQSLIGVNLPSSLQSLSFFGDFNRS